MDDSDEIKKIYACVCVFGIEIYKNGFENFFLALDGEYDNVIIRMYKFVC